MWYWVSIIFSYSPTTSQCFHTILDFFESFHKSNKSLKDEKNCNKKKKPFYSFVIITNSNMNLLLPKKIEIKNWMKYSPIQIHNVALIIFIYSFRLVLLSSFFWGQKYYNLSWSPLMCISSASQSILANWKKPFAKALKTQMVLFTLS